jgi:hypothetical protein
LRFLFHPVRESCVKRNGILDTSQDILRSGEDVMMPNLVVKQVRDRGFPIICFVAAPEISNQLCRGCHQQAAFSTGFRTPGYEYEIPHPVTWTQWAKGSGPLTRYEEFVFLIDLPVFAGICAHVRDKIVK